MAISNLSDNIRNVFTLETGIGWPDSYGTVHKNYRYAVYKFDEEKSVFGPYMDKSSHFSQNKTSGIKIDMLSELC